MPGARVWIGSALLGSAGLVWAWQGLGGLRVLFGCRLGLTRLGSGLGQIVLSECVLKFNLWIVLWLGSSGTGSGDASMSYGSLRFRLGSARLGSAVFGFSSGLRRFSARVEVKNQPFDCSVIWGVVVLERVGAVGSPSCCFGQLRVRLGSARHMAGLGA